MFLDKPLISLLEVATIKLNTSVMTNGEINISLTHESSAGTEGTWMHTFQNQVPGLIDILDSRSCRISPRQKDDALSSGLCHGVNDLLGQLLPAFA